MCAADNTLYSPVLSCDELSLWRQSLCWLPCWWAHPLRMGAFLPPVCLCLISFFLFPTFLSILAKPLIQVQTSDTCTLTAEEVLVSSPPKLTLRAKSRSASTSHWPLDCSSFFTCYHTKGHKQHISSRQSFAFRNQQSLRWKVNTSALKFGEIFVCFIIHLFHWFLELQISVLACGVLAWTLHHH